ncbi:hypothetical protein [Ruegeria sp. HKCCA5426]|uniref:hypothetical protein n=1 Tax=Ruegeria sp. HKCCA5426 TaxID=2682985 RepID=UPI00148933ED|nr:hypothetical protein [Ruegeria sp. HKCCA5426]
MDPDILIQGNLAIFEAMASSECVVMAKEVVKSLDNPGVAAKLQRAVDVNALTDQQVRSFEAEVNTGFQYGGIDAMFRYLTPFLEFMRSDSMREFYKNSKDRNNSWHDQDFFRAFLRASSDRSWLKLAGKEHIATLNGDAMREVIISSEAPKVHLVDGRVPDVVHFAGSAWRRNAAALGYFELAPTTTGRDIPEQIDILKLEQRARQVGKAEASAQNWRNAHENLRRQHEELLEKWNELKPKYSDMVTRDAVPPQRKQSKKMAQRALTTIALGEEYFRMGVALMRSAHALSSGIDRYIIYKDDETDTSFLPVPDFVEIRRCGSNRFRYPDSPFASRMDKSTPLVDVSTKDATVLFLKANTIIYRDVLDQMFDEIEASSVLVHAMERPDDFDWMARTVKIDDGERTEGFNLKKRASEVGIHIPNITLSAAVFGRAPTVAGWEFSARVDELLQDPPFQIWPNSHYLNDEPFIAIAYLAAQARHGLVHRPLTNDLYMGLRSGEHFVLMDEEGQVHVGNELPAIVYFAGKNRRDTEIYRAMLRRFAPVHDEG